MTDAEKLYLEEQILAYLRTSYLQEYNSTYFAGEIYLDYRDEIDPATVGEIISCECPSVELDDHVHTWYDDCEWEYKRELIKETCGALERDTDHFPDGLSVEQETWIADYIGEHVQYCAPTEHFLDQMIDVNIMMDTGDANYDFVLNSVYPCWYGQYGERISDKAGIVWLAKTQHYTKTALWKALQDDHGSATGFLGSVRSELINLPSHMSTVTFLVRMTVGELLRINDALQWRERQNGRQYDPKGYPDCGYLILDKSTVCGLFDTWSGGGSILDIQLEKDVRVPIKYIWQAVPDEMKGRGYSVGRVYGLCSSAWGETLKAMRFPKTIIRET